LFSCKLTVVEQASEDATWLKSNLDAFKRLAELGDEDFIDVVKELESREDFRSRL
jgi:hypothetical protein